jgi:hypothetical protein
MTLAAVASCRFRMFKLIFLKCIIPTRLSSLCSRGVTRIVGVANQRVKECNRIAATVEALQACGIRSRELPTGIEIEGAMTSLKHAQVYRSALAIVVGSDEGVYRRCVLALLPVATTIASLWQLLSLAASYRSSA